ncbi:MAG: hypothetical protein JEY91_11885 [Spirochaetaceae bacterium]|nr:hypothetical protein [Spirochaetaceae bacterium]
MKLTEKMWNCLTWDVARLFTLDKSELEKLRGNWVAKVIACIPYLAECRNPEKTALKHLGIYIESISPSTKSLYAHRKEDDISPFKRLEPISQFKGGKRTIIEKGMNLLALISLEDHQHDLEEDRMTGKYNPILSGAWDYTMTKQSLVAAIEKVPCTEMDNMMHFGTWGFWNTGK